MAKFKKGDKVVRHTSRFSKQWMDRTANPLGVFVVSDAANGVVCLSGVASGWDDDYFDLYEEPQPEPVTVTESAVQQIPGVPDGYRLVRIGAPKKGEQYVTGYNAVCTADENLYDYAWAIVEPIVPPAPPTPIPTKVKVQLNRYLLGDLSDPSTLFVLVATNEYMDDRSTSYRLLGPSETLELEVEV